jgi:hypothetical protein
VRRRTLIAAATTALALAGASACSTGADITALPHPAAAPAADHDVTAGDGRSLGRVAARVGGCLDVPSDFTVVHGCLFPVDVTFHADEDDFMVSPSDFYVLDADQAHYNEGGGNAAMAYADPRALELSTINAGESISGLIAFDAPEHGTLVYDPGVGATRVTWAY